MPGRVGGRALLSPESERELIAAAEGGDDSARDRLVRIFMPSIGAMARRYQRSTGLERDDLVQEGVVGLLRAAARFDPQMGTPFWAYASWWVRQAMQQLVAEVTGPVVLSDRALRRLARIKESRREHLAEHGTEPSVAEISSATELNRKQVEDLLATERRPRGLDEPLSTEDGGTTFGELISDPTAEEQYTRVVERIEIHEIRGLMTRLEEREQNVLQSHYGLGCEAETLREIAAELELSVERVRQIEEKALGKLREAAAAA
jgi:RNA polymerase sigma factor (sigma-70 family)